MFSLDFPGGNTVLTGNGQPKLPYPACHKRHSRILRKKNSRMGGLFTPVSVCRFPRLTTDFAVVNLE